MITISNDPFDYQVLNLTQQFYNDFPSPPYTEIMHKERRPYGCLLIQSHYGYFICIPYRSHIKHKYSYKFKRSVRSQKTSSGLDYSKIIIIKNNNYIGRADAVIDQDEYNETRDNIEYIKHDAQQYIDDYVKQMQGKVLKYDKREFQRIYEYSTLKYFHQELGIIDN